MKGKDDKGKEEKPKGKQRKLSEPQVNQANPLKRKVTVHEPEAADVDEEDQLELELADLEEYVNTLRRELGRPPITEAERSERKRRAQEVVEGK